MEEDYTSINRNLWNTKTKYHLHSSYYNVDEFLSNKNYITLKQTELDLLKNVENKRILHLQCHFGLDTLSLARLGAKEVIGIDLSNIAIENACQLAEKTNLNNIVQFICCDIYQIENYLKINNENDLFDIVFTSYGTTKWFPDLNKWAKIIENYLKPQGSFIIVDFHPMLWTFDDQFEHLVTYSYFNQQPSIILKRNFLQYLLKYFPDVFFYLVVEYSKGTYTNPDAPIQEKSIRWNHSLAEIITSLIEHHLKIDIFQEFDNLPLNCFHSLCRTSDDIEQYQFKGFIGKLPLSYAIKATKIN